MLFFSFSFSTKFYTDTREQLIFCMACLNFKHIVFVVFSEIYSKSATPRTSIYTEEFTNWSGAKGSQLNRSQLSSPNNLLVAVHAILALIFRILSIHLCGHFTVFNRISKTWALNLPSYAPFPLAYTRWTSRLRGKRVSRRPYHPFIRIYIMMPTYTSYSIYIGGKEYNEADEKRCDVLVHSKTPNIINLENIDGKVY